MELCGSGYVIDYCVSAFHKSREEEAFKNYVADGLYALVNQNSSYACRFEELLHPLSEEEKKKLKEVWFYANQNQSTHTLNLKAKFIF